MKVKLLSKGTTDCQTIINTIRENLREFGHFVIIKRQIIP